MNKPSAFPLFIDRLRASPAWQYTHHLFGMFMRLLIEMARSERPGYIPNDIAALRRAARGHEVQFEKQDWPVLKLRFQKTPDGLWWYSDTLLEALELVKPKGVEQVSPPKTKVGGICIKKSFAFPEGLETYFEEAYKLYPRHIGKSAAKKAFWKACRESANGSGQIGAAQVIIAAITVYAKTPAGNRGGFTPHMSTWLNQGRFLDDQKEWHVKTDNRPSDAAMAQPKHYEQVPERCANNCGQMAPAGKRCCSEKCEGELRAFAAEVAAKQRRNQERFDREAGRTK